MRKFSLFLIPLVLFACSGEQNEEQEEKENFVSQITVVDDSYPEIDPFVMEVMEGLQICTMMDSVMTLPPCSAEYFRVFKFRPEKDWKVGFIIEMVPGLFGAPVHQLVVVEEAFGKYQIINQYLGALIEYRTTLSGYNDLLIGYDDPEVGLVSIRHEWNGKKYDPVDVEEINNHFVKPEMKDSINAIFLPAFSAGY
ncbi:MAG: hypothetical protein MI810_23250 [Flavobacteriales bacterium]|nr:hypothetical protein [Flavobacteriales bacterium]